MTTDTGSTAPGADPLARWFSGELKKEFQKLGTIIAELGHRMGEHERLDDTRYQDTVRRLDGIAERLDGHASRIDDWSEVSTVESSGDQKALAELARSLRAELKAARRALEQERDRSASDLEQERKRSDTERRRGGKLVRILVGAIVALALGGGAATYREVTRPEKSSTPATQAVAP